MRAISLDEMVALKIDDAAILDSIASSLPIHVKTKNRILASYTDYKKSKGGNGIPALNLKSPLPDQFFRLYKGKAAKYGLDWIEKIATTSKYGYCPMCGSETHKTVEHFLPRSPWSEFSFLSLNLVPSCGICNSKRGNVANAPGTKPRMLHPYFDGKLLKKKLHFTKITGPYEIPKFEPDVFESLSAAEKLRVRNHLKKCIDLVVYHQYCTNRWSEMQGEAKRAESISELKRRVKNLHMDSKRVGGLNSWKTAFYAGLMNSPSITKWLFQNRKLF